MPYGLIHKITGKRSFTLFIKDELIECTVSRRAMERMTEKLHEKMVITFDFEEVDSSNDDNNKSNEAEPRKIVYIDTYNKPILLASGNSKIHDIAKTEMDGTGIKVFTRLRSKKHCPAICFVTYTGKVYEYDDVNYHNLDEMKSMWDKIRKIHHRDMEDSSAGTSPTVLEETKNINMPRENNNDIFNKIVSQTATAKQIKHQIENRLNAIYNSGAGYIEPVNSANPVVAHVTNPVINSVSNSVPNQSMKGLPQTLIDTFSNYEKQINNYDAIVRNANQSQNNQQPNDYTQGELDEICMQQRQGSNVTEGKPH
jgi:hypothetical protein